MKRILALSLPLFMASIGCKDPAKDDLIKKQAQLSQKEQELIEKENYLLLKEIELSKREAGLDSLRKLDSLPAQDPVLTGFWDVKMTCTETTCQGSVVGDTKTEQWEMFYQLNVLIARVTSNGKLVRIYTGFYTGNTIELIDERANSGTAAKMVVRLRIVDDKSMKGQREIIQENECKVIYALELEKLKN